MKEGYSVPYITYEEYQSLNTGVEITQSEFDTLYFYAETAIDCYLGRHFDSVDDTFKRAVALQISTSKESGGIKYYSDNSSNVQLTSESVPDYSYSVSAKSTRSQYNSAKDVYGLFPIVAALLQGYFVKAVDVIL